MGATLVLVSIAFCFWLIFRFSQVVFIFFIAVVLGTMLQPVVVRLTARGVPRLSAGLLVYGLLFLLLASLVYFLAPMVAQQSSRVAAGTPAYYYGMREWMKFNPNLLVASLGELLPPTLPVLDLIEQAGEQMLASAGQVLGYLELAASALFTLIITLMMAFYWTLDGPRTIRSFLLLVPKDRRDEITELVAGIETRVSAYVTGQAVLCAIIGAMALVAYSLIGLPNALALALLAGLLEAVPVLGPTLGAIPAALVAFSISPSSAIWVIAATVVIQQVENAFLLPRVMHRAVKVNPFVSLLAIFGFSYLFGIAGALVAIPAAAILQMFLDRYIFNATAVEPEVSAGRDYVSRLRLDTIDLAQDVRKQARLIDGSPLFLKQHDRLLDEIEAITTDLDLLLAQLNTPENP